MLSAYEENYANKKYIERRIGHGIYEGFTVFEIDPHKVSWHGFNIRQNGAYVRRKFENLLVLMHPEEQIKFVYAEH
jgi:hypothetical protein